MHTNYLYLSLLPESLIYSQLTPEKFGMYMAIGSSRKSERPAIFFRVKEEIAAQHFDLEKARARCLAHADGSPRRSTYVAVYGVLAQLPIEALESLYLTTHAGFTLELQPAAYTPDASTTGLHYYQELCPVIPRVASALEPREFCRRVTDPREAVSLPRLVFADLHLGDLATNPAAGHSGNLPYRNIEHLRECLVSLADGGKAAKIVFRELAPDELSYSLIRRGVYVGDQSEFRFYPLPSAGELEREHYLWWHSARSVRQY